MTGIDRSSIWKDTSMATVRALSNSSSTSRKTSSESCFLERIDDAEKNWKFSADDIKERKYWEHYMTAFEQCLNATSTGNVPWYVIPADDKENARLIVSQIVLDTFEGLKMSYPRTTAARRKELLKIRKRLAM
jgi:hypothetical protein